MLGSGPCYFIALPVLYCVISVLEMPAQSLFVPFLPSAAQDARERDKKLVMVSFMKKLGIILFTNIALFFASFGS